MVVDARRFLRYTFYTTDVQLDEHPHRLADSHGHHLRVLIVLSRAEWIFLSKMCRELSDVTLAQLDAWNSDMDRTCENLWVGYVICVDEHRKAIAVWLGACMNATVSRKSARVQRQQHIESV